jgi:acyl-CoA hydrolase
MLSPGAGVVTFRGLVRYVVTEYGVAYLHGKRPSTSPPRQSIRERAKALIEIAHPKFRDGLYEYCEQTKWLQRPARGRKLLALQRKLAVFKVDLISNAQTAVLP